jgi:hypothetical protein
MQSTEPSSKFNYVKGLIIIVSAILAYAIFGLIKGAGELQWFMLSVLNGAFFFFLIQRLKQRKESVKNMRLLFTAMFLTALLLLAGLWFIQKVRTLVPTILILVSAALWFISLLIDRNSD